MDLHKTISVIFFPLPCLRTASFEVNNSPREKRERKTFMKNEQLPNPALSPAQQFPLIFRHYTSSQPFSEILLLWF